MKYCLTRNCALPVGFNVETVAYKGIDFITWDVGSRTGRVSDLIALLNLSTY